MSLPPLFLDPFGRDDLEYNILHKVREEKRECSHKVLKKLTKKHIRKGDTLCTLDLVRDSLISKGVTEGRCEYSKNDFSERLNIDLANTTFCLCIQLFPKRDPKKDINLTIDKTDIQKDLDSDTTPESVADFVLGLSEWLPEYYAIETHIQEEEMKKKTVHDLAVDLLKRNIDTILSKKGYSYSVTSSYFMNTASVKITFSPTIHMTLKVDLEDEFLEDVIRMAESLPSYKLKGYSLREMDNIHNCVVIENYDHCISKHLKDGGNNIISHMGKLWIPNMSAIAIEKAKTEGYLGACYTKEDTLPDDAPMLRLKAVNDKLGSMFADLSDEERDAAIDKIIQGVGYGAHYNRHRYKMPAEILDLEEK